MVVSTSPCGLNTAVKGNEQALSQLQTAGYQAQLKSYISNCQCFSALSVSMTSLRYLQNWQCGVKNFTSLQVEWSLIMCSLYSRSLIILEFGKYHSSQELRAISSSNIEGGKSDCFMFLCFIDVGQIYRGQMRDQRGRFPQRSPTNMVYRLAMSSGDDERFLRRQLNYCQRREMLRFIWLICCFRWSIQRSWEVSSVKGRCLSRGERQCFRFWSYKSCIFCRSDLFSIQMALFFSLSFWYLAQHSCIILLTLSNSPLTFITLSFPPIVMPRSSNIFLQIISNPQNFLTSLAISLLNFFLRSPISSSNLFFSVISVRTRCRMAYRSACSSQFLS